MLGIGASICVNRIFPHQSARFPTTFCRSGAHPVGARRLTSHVLNLESVAHSAVRLVLPHTSRKADTMAVSISARFSLSSDSVEALRRQISGSVLLNNEDGYDAARTIWNAMIDRSPTL